MPKASVDPQAYVIKRRRKLYRFALFSNLEHCFEYDEWMQAKPLRAQRNVTVEVGAGTALFSVELAARHPERQFVAVDVKADRMQKGATLAQGKSLNNIEFIRARADQLEDLFERGTVEQLWLTFSDPFPKKSDAKRRMTHAKFLEIYKNILVEKGALLQKTDSHALFDWSLEQLVQNGWVLSELTYDLHASELSDDYKILTTYETRWLGEGYATMLVRATKPAAPAPRHR